MRKIPKGLKTPKRAKIKKPKPIVLKINPYHGSNQLVLPRIEYEIVASLETDVKYTGPVTPLPTILYFLLSSLELRVLAVILNETYKNGKCNLSLDDISKHSFISVQSTSGVMKKLRHFGIVMETEDGVAGLKRFRTVNFETIQRLSDLMEGEDIGVCPRLRQRCRKRNWNNITKEDIQEAYDNRLLPPGHDPEEEEEYD